MNNILSTALSGLNNAITRVNKAAHNIATSPTQADAGKADTMIEDIVDISLAKHSYKANLAVIKTADDMHDTLLRTLDTKA